MAVTIGTMAVGPNNATAIAGQIRGRFWICVNRQKAGLPISESYLEGLESMYEGLTDYFVGRGDLDPTKVLPLVDAFGHMNGDLPKAIPFIFALPNHPGV